MISLLLRLAKRLLVFMPGIVVAYFAVENLYPAIERRIPAALAILATYTATAYILIPAALRLVRIFLKPRHIPLYCVTPDGFASDPVNIGVAGTKEQLTKAMVAAGWHKADSRTVSSLLRMIVSIVLRQSYPTAPFSSLYLFGRKQDIGFQSPFANNPSQRHHVRFWAVKAVGDPAHSEHVLFWQKYHVTSVSDRVLWVGAASRDIGIAPIRHNAQLTHMIHHDTNAERELIVEQLKKTGLVKNIRSITAGRPYKLRNRVWFGHFRADGKMRIVELK